MNRNLSIAVVGHVGNSVLVRGGLEVQLDALADGLTRRGHIVMRSLSATRTRPDVFLFLGAFYGLGDAFSAAQGVPRVVMPILLHDDHTLRWWRPAVDRLRGRTGRSLLSHRMKMLRQADLVITNSQFEATEARAWGAKTVQVVPAGVDLTRFRIRNAVDSLDPNWRRRTVPVLESPTPLVVSIGRFERRKNHLAVARACHDLGVRVLFIGRRSPTEMGWLDELTDLCGPGVEIWEGAPEMAVVAALSRANVHVLASRHETAGLVSLEAAACGARPVTIDQPTAREYFGGFGVFATSDDPGDLRNAIGDALLLGRLRPAEEAQLDQFSWDTVCSSLERDFLGLLSTSLSDIISDAPG